jgi:hypothetical protein
MIYTRQVLDLTFVFPHKVTSTSYFISFLQSILFREVPLDIPSHTQTAENDTHDLSAGPLGTKSIKPDPNLKTETYRYHRITPGMVERFQCVAKKLKDKWYDFFIYFQWLLSIAVFIFLIDSVLSWQWKKPGLLIAYIPAMIILRILSKYTWHCSESTSYIDSVAWKYFNFRKHSFVSPYILYKMVRCNPEKWELVNRTRQ